METFEVLKLISGVSSTAIALVGLIYVVLKFRREEDIRNQDLFFKFREKFSSDPILKAICIELEKDEPQFPEDKFSTLDRYNFCGFYEEISIYMRKGVLDKHQVLNMMAYFALQAAKSKEFLKEDISEKDFYWKEFFTFVSEMKELESRQTR